MHNASQLIVSLDVTATILVFQNNETAAIMMNQTSPMGVGLYSLSVYAKVVFCLSKPKWRGLVT